MNRMEFVQALRRSLSGKMSYQEVNEHIEYYENYFDTELAHGKSEREILEKLGDPRLIAKTILQTSGDGTEHGDGETENGRESGRRWRRSENGRVFHIPGWLFFTIFAVIFFLILWLVGSVLSFFLPVLLPVLLVWLIWRNRRQ